MQSISKVFRKYFFDIFLKITFWFPYCYEHLVGTFTRLTLFMFALFNRGRVCHCVPSSKKKEFHEYVPNGHDSPCFKPG